MSSGLYNLWRDGLGPTLYPPNKTPVTADVLEIGFIYAAVIIAFSFLIVLPGIRGRARLFNCVRIFLAIFITASIMLCNFGQEWEIAELHTVTQYRAGLREEINASISVKIGLRSVNITLKTDPTVQPFEGGKVNETINYNERFSWDNQGWTQGRGGFGPFAGEFNQEYRAAQWKGVPYPILWIAEYFTLDGEGVRWGRHYRQAGYYTHIMLWTAFPLWMIALILFPVVIRYGGYFSVLTGLSMLLGLILFATIRNPLQLKIPFEDGFLVFSWGWCFWLNLITGLICVAIGVIIVFMDLRFPEYLSTFFGVDITQDLEEFYIYQIEIDSNENVGGKKKKGRKYSIVVRPPPQSNGAAQTVKPVGDGDSDNSEDYENVAPPPANIQRMFRKKTILGPLQRSLKKKPRPPPRQKPPAADPADELYENPPSRVQFAAGHDNVTFEGDVKVNMS